MALALTSLTCKNPTPKRQLLAVTGTIVVSVVLIAIGQLLLSGNMAAWMSVTITGSAFLGIDAIAIIVKNLKTKAKTQAAPLSTEPPPSNICSAEPQPSSSNTGPAEPQPSSSNTRPINLYFIDEPRSLQEFASFLPEEFVNALTINDIAYIYPAQDIPEDITKSVEILFSTIRNRYWREKLRDRKEKILIIRAMDLRELKNKRQNCNILIFDNKMLNPYTLVQEEGNARLLNRRGCGPIHLYEDEETERPTSL